MNKIFRVVWNRALGQLVVASEHASSSCRAGRSATGGARIATRTGKTLLALALGMAGIAGASAHTISVGYTNNGTGNITFWYGTYHQPTEASYTEGSFDLTAPNGTTTNVDFSYLVDARPDGLVDGTNNFYAAAMTGTALTADNETGNADADVWQGVSFTNLTPGTYTYTYVPIASPTQVWDPYDPVLTNTLTITGADLNGTPLTAGNVYDENAPELNYQYSILFEGGTFKPTTDVTENQPVTLWDGGGTVDTSNGDVTFTGGVDGYGGLTKTGTGTLTLTGDSTYTGGTTVEEGTLAGDTDSLVGTIVNDATVDFVQNTDGTYAGDMSGTGVLQKDGSGTVTLTGNNTYTGGTVINDGTLAVSGNGTIGSGDILDNGTLDLSGANHDSAAASLSGSGDVLLGSNDLNLDGGNGAFTGSISGSGGLNVVGGNQSLSGTNTYTGGTGVSSGGTLTIDGDAALGSGNLTLADGTLFTTGSTTSTRSWDVEGTGTVSTATGTTLTHSGAVTGTGDFVKDGSGDLLQSGVLSQTGNTVVNGGTLTLTGTNTYGGDTIVNNGATVSVADDANLGHAGGDIQLNGGTLQTTGDVNTARQIDIGTSGTVDTAAGTTLTSSAGTSGNGTLYKNGDGTLEIDGNVDHTGAVVVDGGILVLNGTNSYDGATAVADGATLQVDSGAALGDPNGGGLLLAGGTLHATGDVDTAKQVTLLGGATIDTDAGVTTDLGGAVVGSGPLVKTGDGTLQLADNNTYTGGTRIDGGTLEIGSDTALGNGGALTFNGGTLHTTGDVDSVRNLVLADNAGIDTDAGTTMTTTGSVSGAGGLVKNGAGTLDIEGVASHTGGTTVNDGTLVLGGHNTYTGGNTINGGTLQVSSDANLGAASNDIALDGGSLHTTASFNTARDVTVGGGSFATDAGTTLKVNGDVSGTGGLVKNGAGTLDIEGVASHTGGTTVNDGTLILGGANTYTGGNTINGGTLQVSSDANLGAASNDIALDGGSLHTTASFNTARDITVDGGSFVTDAGTTLKVNGDVSGTDGLVKNGAGTLDIEGVASHTGGTTVNDGTLILGGANTYTGGNTVNGGTLQISSDANLGATSNGVTLNGGNLTVTASMTTGRDMVFGSHGATITTLDGVTLTDAGDMSGSGGLVKKGGGTLVVSGDNTFTGGTLIQGGVIRIDSGSSLGTGTILLQGGTLQTVATLGTGQQVLISGDSGVNVDADTTTVLSGNLTAAAGDGCFIKSGAGKLSLTGSANLASGTCVQQGILSANGNLTSSYVHVDGGAMLRGTGSISGPVTVEGTLAAGNSPGTLSVNGTVTMQSTATLEVDIDGLGIANGAGNYSRVLVLGAGNTFHADGTLAPTLRGITGNASNTYTPAMGDTYRIVTADGGITGYFTSIAQPAAGLPTNTRFIAFYGTDDGHSIDLRVAPVSYAGLLGANAKRNGLAAAGALDGAVAAQDGGNATAAQSALLYAVTALTADQVGPMVTSLSGEVHADEAAAARAAGLGIQRDVADHLGTDVQGADAANRAWANLTRDGNRSIGDEQGSGFETGTDRTTAGIDLYAENGTVFGVGVTHHDTHTIAHGGSGNIRGDSGIVYAQQAMGRFVLDGMASYGTTDWTTHRADPLGGTGLDSRTSGKDAMASLTLRLPMTTVGGNRVEPYASVIRQKVDRDGVAERGGSAAALTLDSLSVTGTRVLAGVTTGSKASDPLTSTLTWRAGLAVGADTGDLLDPTVHDTMSGQRFDTAAPGVGRSFVQVNANGTMRLSRSTYLYGGLTTERGSQRSAYGVTAGVRMAF